MPRLDRPGFGLVLSALLVPAMSYSGVAWAQVAAPPAAAPAPVAAPAAPAGNTAAAKPHLDAGAKATAAKDWPKALDEYDAANKADASPDAQEGIANAEYQLKHDPEAYAAYDELLKKYGDKITRGRKAVAEVRLKEIGDRTGTVSVDVGVSGADVAIDGRKVGTTPLDAPIRVAPGAHTVRVSKDGYDAFEDKAAVTANGTSSIKGTMNAQSAKVHVTIKETAGKPVHVLVDNVDVGDAPWSGEVDPGSHEVRLRAVGLGTSPQKIQFDRGKPKDLELTAVPQTTPVKVSTNDGKGLIYFDDKLMGEGSFTGDIPSGIHKVRITRENFDPFEEDIDFRERDPVSRTVTLKVSSKVQAGSIQHEGRPLYGIYGGLDLIGTYLATGMQSSIQKSCEPNSGPPTLVSCTGTSGGLGGGIDGFVGYHWDPIGVELYGAFLGDTTSPKETFAASSQLPGSGPDPARTEAFNIYRVGGVVALRIRLTLQGEKLRFSLAAGVGFSLRAMGFSREISAPAVPTSPTNPLKIPSDLVTYVSPVVQFNPMLYYRFSPQTALGLGIMLHLENTEVFDSVPHVDERKDIKVSPRNGITTPAYDLSAGPQVFIGPVIGMMFGP